MSSEMHDHPKIFQHLNDLDTAAAIESQLDTSSLVLPPVPLLPRDYPSSFSTTSEFWEALLSERVRARKRVTLHDVLLSEWFPRSPGLFHTPEAAHAREEAQYLEIDLTEEEESIYFSSNPSDPVVYNVYGKQQMLRGGIGCIRLKERETADGRLYFMSVSTSLSAHEGVPIALTPDDYGRHIDEITERGVLPCTVTGQLRFLPDNMLTLYSDYTGVPRLYLEVSELVRKQSTSALELGDPTVSAAVLFQADEPWPVVSAAYVSFITGRNGTLAQRLPWLEHYVGEMHGGTVITDFDEQMTRFPQAVFSLEKVANGTLDESEIRNIARAIGVDDMQIGLLLARQQRYGIVLNRINIGAVRINVGDKFENIGAGAIIVNRSSLTNALNRTQADYGADAMQALKELADAVTQSGQPEAIDSLNALNEELAKPQHSKNRLRTWLHAIISALPDAVDVAAAAAKVTTLIIH